MKLVELLKLFGSWSHDNTDINRVHWPDHCIAMYLWGYFDATIVQGKPTDILVIRLCSFGSLRGQ